jgi:uncharacterized phage protein gp47/JayE
VIQQVRNDLAGEGVTQVWIRRTFEAALSTVLGGLLWAWYVWVDTLAKQGNPLTATGFFLGLWARIWGLIRRAAGTATGTAMLTGTTGSTQPSGSFLIGPDGQEYTLDADTTLEGDGVAFPNVTASAAGDAFNLPVGTPLTVASPASGISGTSLVGTTGIAGGQAAESDEVFRGRLLVRINKPADGGTVEDFERWARAASTSVYRVWVYRCGRTGSQAGHVLTMFAVNGANPIPSGGLVSTVSAYITPRSPAGSKPTTQAPTGQSVAIGISVPVSTLDATKALIVGYLRSLFAVASPGGVVANLDMRAAISRAGIPYEVTAVGSGSGSADAVSTTNLHLLYLGTVTWGVYSP